MVKVITNRWWKPRLETYQPGSKFMISASILCIQHRGGISKYSINVGHYYSFSQWKKRYLLDSRSWRIDVFYILKGKGYVFLAFFVTLIDNPTKLIKSCVYQIAILIRVPTELVSGGSKLAMIPLCFTFCIYGFNNPKSFFQASASRAANSLASTVTCTAAFLEGSEMSRESARSEGGLRTKSELCDLGQGTLGCWELFPLWKMGLVGEFNEIRYVKHLAQCLSQRSRS